MKRSAEAEERIKSLLPQARRIARKIHRFLPSSIELEDLAQAGMLGLIDAAEKFDPSDGIKFETYAQHRIRGAIIDGLRQDDWVPRTIRQQLRQLEKALVSLEQRFGRPPKDSEVADYLGMDLEGYRLLLAQSHGAQMQLLNESEYNKVIHYYPDDRDGPEQTAIKKDNIRALRAAISHLNARKQKVMAMYYDQGMTMLEIGYVIGVSESRVSQLLAEAIEQLHSHFKVYGL